MAEATLELIAVRITPDLLGVMTNGSRASVELVDNGDGCYRMVGASIDAIKTAAEGRAAPDANGAAGARYGRNGRAARPSSRRGQPIDPNDLPVIRFVRFPKACSGCGHEILVGTQARWNPETKDVFCNTCKPLP